MSMRLICIYMYMEGKTDLDCKMWSHVDHEN